MNDMNKHLDNLFKLSAGEHSLEEVINMALELEEIKKAGKLMNEGVCPDCGSTKTETRFEQNSPDDYETVFYCNECGLTAS